MTRPSTYRSDTNEGIVSWFIENPALVKDGTEETAHTGNNAYTFLTNKEENTMTTNTRRIVTVQLIDQDQGLPVEDSIVAVFKDVVTEDTDSVTIQELIMKEDVKAALEKHNKVRQGTVNTEILDRTGQEVKLRAIKLKNLTWVVR